MLLAVKKIKLLFYLLYFSAHFRSLYRGLKCFISRWSGETMSGCGLAVAVTTLVVSLLARWVGGGIVATRMSARVVETQYGKLLTNDCVQVVHSLACPHRQAAWFTRPSVQWAVTLCDWKSYCMSSVALADVTGFRAC